MSQQPKKKRVNYIDNAKLLEEVLAHLKAAKEARERGELPPRLNDYLGKCILLIPQNLSLKPCFINYSFREEMVSDAVENILMYFENFDPKLSNPFAYYTQISYYSFLRRIAKEEKLRYITLKNFQHKIIHGTEGGPVGHHDILNYDDSENIIFTPKMFDNMNEFMSRFEAKEAAKKSKRKETKDGLDKFFPEETFIEPTQNEERDE